MTLKAKVKFPVNTVKVGSRIYALVVWDANEATARDRYAEVDHDMEIIRVAMAYGARRAALELVHELIHCACYRGILNPEDGEERTVSKAANMWTALWCDNAKLFAWLHALITDTTKDDVPFR